MFNIFSCSGSKPFNVPCQSKKQLKSMCTKDSQLFTCVPTGINTGVSTQPCISVEIFPTLALDLEHLAITLYAKLVLEILLFSVIFRLLIAEHACVMYLIHKRQELYIIISISNMQIIYSNLNCLLFTFVESHPF